MRDPKLAEKLVPFIIPRCSLSFCWDEQDEAISNLTIKKEVTVARVPRWKVSSHVTGAPPTPEEYRPVFRASKKDAVQRYWETPSGFRQCRTTEKDLWTRHWKNRGQARDFVRVHTKSLYVPPDALMLARSGTIYAGGWSIREKQGENKEALCILGWHFHLIDLP